MGGRKVIPGRRNTVNGVIEAGKRKKSAVYVVESSSMRHGVSRSESREVREEGHEMSYVGLKRLGSIPQMKRKLQNIKQLGRVQICVLCKAL